MVPTAKQKEALAAIRRAIQSGDRLLMLLYGGVRAGKSTAACQGLSEHMGEHPGETYALGAYTLRQCIEIFEPKFREIAQDKGWTFHANRGSSNPHFVMGDNEILLSGGNDAGRDRNIQGLTWAGLILDELPLLNRDYVMQSEARVSAPGGLRIYTANKPNPYHWTTKHYYNRAMKGQIAATLLDWDTRDNPHIGQDYIDERINEYDDLYRSRFINNEFVLDATPIYAPLFADVDTDSSKGATVLYGNGPGYDVIQAADTDYGLCVYDANVATLHDIQGLIPDLDRVFVNSDRPMLARAIRRAGKTVRGYDAMFQPRRVEYTQNAIANGNLRIHPNADSLIEAISMYTVGGVYTGGYVRGLEVLGEYLARKQ